MHKIILITKAISDKNRIRALMALRRQSLCVCQIVDLLGLAPSTVSKHLSVLYHAGLVSTEKKGIVWRQSSSDTIKLKVIKDFWLNFKKRKSNEFQVKS